MENYKKHLFCNRRLLKKLKLKQKSNYLKEREFPHIWKAKWDLDQLLSMILKDISLHRALSRVILESFRPLKSNSCTLNLSQKYLHNTKNILPSYYSDRERIIVIINRYNSESFDENLIYWSNFFCKKDSSTEIQLVLGILLLDHSLKKDLNREKIKDSISYIESANSRRQPIKYKHLNSAILAFAYYLIDDLEKSLKTTEALNNILFFQRFAKLIAKNLNNEREHYEKEKYAFRSLSLV